MATVSFAYRIKDLENDLGSRPGSKYNTDNLEFRGGDPNEPLFTAHHIIPGKDVFRANPTVQKAINDGYRLLDSKHDFTVNEKWNGIWLPNLSQDGKALGSYLFTAGPVLKDGETLGVSETERFRVAKAEDGSKITLEYEEAGHG